MAASASAKVIQIRTDTAQGVAGVNALNAAFGQLANQNQTIAALTAHIAALQAALNGAAGGAGGGGGGGGGGAGGAANRFGALGAAAQAAMQRLSGMSGALGGMAFAGAALGAAAAAGGLIALGTAAVKASAQMETYRASLTTVLGDSDKAAMAFDRLTAFAAKTPFSLDQSVQGFIKLKALGLTPSEAAMTSYGNTASALGKDLNQMVEAVADAATGEFERLKEFGIKAKQNGDQVALTFQGVTKTVGNNSKDIQAYLMAIGSVNFAGAMDKQAKTFNGAMSNLDDTWTQTLAAIGDAGLADSMGGVIRGITDGLSEAKPLLVAVGSMMGGIVDGIVSVGSGIGSMFSSMLSNGGQGLTFLETLTVAVNLIGQGFQVVGSVVGAVFSAMGQIVGGITQGIRSVFGQLWDWLGVSSSQTSNQVGTSFLGALRAGKFVAQNLQTIFSTALGAIGGAFSIVGQRITAFLSGDWNAFDGMGGALKAQFVAAGNVLNGIAVKANAIANDSKGAAAAWDRLKGKTDKKGGLSLDQLAGAAPDPAKAAGKGGKGGADDAAKKAADRAKRENDFWETLKNQTTAAGMLTNQAEVYNKQLEYRKIIERDLNDGEKTRIANALNELNTAKALTGLKQKLFEAQNHYTVELGRAKGLTDAQRAVENEIFKDREANLNKGVDINTAAYKLEEDSLRNQLLKNKALDAQNDLLAKAREFAAQLSSGFKASNDLKTLNDQYQALVDGMASGDISKDFADQFLAGFNTAKTKIEQDAIRVLLDMSPSMDRDARTQSANNRFSEAMATIGNANLSPDARKKIENEIFGAHQAALNKIKNEVYDDWTDMFDSLADTFGGKLGSVFSKVGDFLNDVTRNANGEGTGWAAKLSNIIGGKGAFESSSKGFLDQTSKMFSNPVGALTDGFKSFKDMFSGNLANGIAGGLGKMQAGGQIGGMVGGLGDMLGLGKGFSKGASIGGTLGGLFGPVGSIVGSLGGGLIGKLFGGKSPEASAALSVLDGKAIAGPTSGSSKATGTAAALAGNVAEQLNSLAAELGGTIGSLSGVSVGYRPGHKAGAFRVDTSGGGKLTGVAAFEDEASAIAFAIKDAIADGAIVGLAPLVQKALGKLGADAAIQFSKNWTSVMNDYTAMTDPIRAAVDAIIKPLDSLKATMISVGATTEDLSQIEQYRTLKLNEALKAQVSGLTETLKMLNGDGSGQTKLAQLDSNMAEFKVMADKISKGDMSVDKDAYTSLVEAIRSGASEVYSTGLPQFQAINDMLKTTTTAFIGGVTSQFNTAAGINPTVTAVDNTSSVIAAAANTAKAQADALLQQAALQTDYLRQLVAGSGATTSGVSPANKPAQFEAINGRYTQAVY